MRFFSAALVSGAAVIGLGATFAHANIMVAPIALNDPTVGVSLASLMSSSQDIQVGNLLFSNFLLNDASGYAIPAGSTETQVQAAASGITVQAAPTPQPGLAFGSAWDTAVGSKSASVSYTVTPILPSLILQSFTAASNAVATGGAAHTIITETISSTAGSSPNLAAGLTLGAVTLAENTPGLANSNQLSATLSAPVPEQIFVKDSIGAYQTGSTGNAFISQVQNTFGPPVPEPATMVLLIGGGALALLPRRRRVAVHVTA